jgi:hypothetical protein
MPKIVMNRNNYQEFRKALEYKKKGQPWYYLEYSVNGMVRGTNMQADKYDRIEQLAKLFKHAPIGKPDTPGYSVIDCLMKLYSKTPGVKEKQQDKIAGLSVSVLEGLLTTDKGAHLRNIQAFCDRYKIGHYALDVSETVQDPDEQHKHKPHNHSTRSSYPALIYFTADGLMYPVTSKKERESIVKSHAQAELKRCRNQTN